MSVIQDTQRHSSVKDVQQLDNETTTGAIEISHHDPDDRYSRSIYGCKSQTSLEPPSLQNVHFSDSVAIDATSEKPSYSLTTASVSTGAYHDDVANGLARKSIGANEHDEGSDDTLLGEYHPKWQSSEPPSEIAPLPSKRARPFWRRTRHRLLNAYQRLFSLVLLGNMVGLVAVMVLRRNAHPFGPSLANLATATAANVTAAILMRQEYFINFLYTALCWTPHWMPLRFRRVIAKFYHFGGVHSGSAVSATMWFTLYTVLLTKQYIDDDFRDITVLTITYALVCLLILICIFAIPRFRFSSHNLFELCHRYGGWLAVALFWAEVILVAVKQSEHPGSESLGMVVVKTPPFWFLIAITFSIVLPWLRLRKVQAWPEILSGHAVRIHFNYAKIGLVMGIRIANSPLHEWHPFASIPEADGSSFSVIVSDAGDWTRKQITHPCSSYWVRGIPLVGVLRMACVFKRVVVVTTGSGIGPCLSLLIAHSIPCRILWSSKDPLEIYGQGTIDAVTRSDPEAMIINTKVAGRPDMVGLTYHLYKQSNAEAVFIISNIGLTQKVVYAMESRGVPAYGPIWDS